MGRAKIPDLTIEKLILRKWSGIGMTVKAHAERIAHEMGCS
jgi:hypothetical protein